MRLQGPELLISRNAQNYEAAWFNHGARITFGYHRH
jgi:hypothetical protein